jgi:hypothetical protein
LMRSSVVEAINSIGGAFGFLWLILRNVASIPILFLINENHVFKFGIRDWIAHNMVLL